MPSVVIAILFPFAAAANGDAPWLTISPLSPADQATVILPTTPVTAGHSYLLTWQMRVEGEKAWRFRADFAGVAIRFDDGGSIARSVVKQTSCWQTLDWQTAWLVVDVPPDVRVLDATMAIVSKEKLPGRFRVREVKLIDLAVPLPLNTGEGELHIGVVDKKGQPTPARVYVLDESGQGIIPPYTYAYTQGTRCFELIDPRLARIVLPAGRYTIRAMKGFDYAIASEVVKITPGQRSSVTLKLERQSDTFEQNWHSIDHHTHLFRHGGSIYPLMDLNDVLDIAQAEGLDFLPFQGVDTASESTRSLVGPACTVSYTEELTRDFWGHICPIYNRARIRVDGEFGSAAPMNMDYIGTIADAGGAVSYAHPYGPLRTGNEYASLADPKAGLIAREWPIDLALGVPCSIDILAKEDARGEFSLKLRDYMRLLNLGFRCGVTGSTDFHLDQGREPIGGLRTYVRGPRGDWQSAARGYAAGATFATNGPLVDLNVSGCTPGMTLTADGPTKAMITLRAESLWGITSVKFWVNGKLVRDIPCATDGIAPAAPDRPNLTIDLDTSGWLLVTVEGPASPDVMSNPEGKPCVPGQFAITSPVYIKVKNHPAPLDIEAAEYFIGWCDAVLRGFDALCAQQSAQGIVVTQNAVDAVQARIAKARAIFAEKRDQSQRASPS